MSAVLGRRMKAEEFESEITWPSKALASKYYPSTSWHFALGSFILPPFILLPTWNAFGWCHRFFEINGDFIANKLGAHRIHAPLLSNFAQVQMKGEVYHK